MASKYAAAIADARAYLAAERVEHASINAKAEATGLFRHTEPKTIYDPPAKEKVPTGCKQTSWKAPTPKLLRPTKRFSQR